MNSFESCCIPHAPSGGHISVNFYQREAFKFTLPPSRSISYMLLGLCNEAGEVAGKYKKVLRGDVTLDEVREDLGKELGDVLWYLAGAATMCGLTLGDLAQGNLTKLQDRKERGLIQGNGDNR